MEKKYTVLIVDDQEINRRILGRVLDAEYNLLFASDGIEAVRMLKKENTNISCVILDIVMPNMDGHDVISTVQFDPLVASIPIIVSTELDSEKEQMEILSLGAYDYLTKPYRPEIILHRVAKAISVREMAETLNLIEKDELTGLYTKNFFYSYCEHYLRENHTQKYDIMCVDIDKFKLVNDLYGRVEGDRLLTFLGSVLKTAVHSIFGVGCRLSADTFLALIPRQQDYYDYLRASFDEPLSNYKLPLKIKLSFGIYHIDDFSLPISAMCDRAQMAADAATGHYDHSCVFYDDDMRSSLLWEQSILDHMNDALTDDQFLIYLQPKYDLRTDMVAGAEALVRWQHPENGLLSPGQFIPLFERNGFITKFDEYVWDSVCAIIRNWLDTKGGYIPVSVNVSRVDLYNPGLPDLLRGLLKKHRLLPKHLRLEITETAYTENPEQIVGVLKQLKSIGFIMEMDDFGSGYSSLNMLTELPIDILKLDMRFMQSKTGREHKKGILQFVLSLAQWMNLPVIAEGVETADQVDMLKKLGCEFVQGYYFAKPMPVSAFDASIGSNVAEPGGEFRILADRSIKPEEITPESSTEAYNRIKSLINTLPGGVAVYEYVPERLSIIYFSKGLPKLFGATAEEYAEHTESNPLWRIHRADIHTINSQLELLRCGKEYVSAIFRIKHPSMGDRWVFSEGNVMSHLGNRVRFNACFSDITQLMTTTEELRDREQEYRLAVDQGHKQLFRFSVADRTLRLSKAASEMLGLDGRIVSNVPEGFIKLGHIAPDSTAAFKGMFDDILNGEVDGYAMVRIITKRMANRWYLCRYTTIFSVDGKPDSAVITAEDATVYHEKELAYQRYRQEIDDRSELAADMFFETDITANIIERAGGRLMWPDIRETISTHSEMLEYVAENVVLPEYKQSFVEAFSHDRLLERFGSGSSGFAGDWQVKSELNIAWVRAETQLILDPYSGHVKCYISVRDITKDKLENIRMKRLAETDGMTGVFNKSTVEKLINARLAACEGRGALMLADLDSLKSINDKYGHAEGDKAIKGFVKMLKKQFRSSDIIGRLGGDEVAAFISGASDLPLIRKMAVSLMRKVSTVRVGDDNMPLRVSIGIAVTDTAGESFDSLYKKADKALYYIKRNGKNDFAFYSDEMQEPGYVFTGNHAHGPISVDSFERTELESMIRALSHIYQIIIVSDITNNSYSVVQHGDCISDSFPLEGQYDELIKNAAEDIDAQYADEFLSFYSRSAMLEAGISGKESVSCEYSATDNDGNDNRLRAETVFLQGNNGALLGVILVRSAD